MSARIVFAAVLAAGLGIGAAGNAADQIRGGEWEFAVQVAMPNLPKLPPGVQLPPGIRMGPGGVTVKRRECLSAGNPVPAAARQPHAGDAHGQCTTDAFTVSGGTVRWRVSCVSAEATTRSEGVAHYDGERMDADITVSTMTPGGPPTTVSQHMTGRWLGPCDR